MSGNCKTDNKEDIEQDEDDVDESSGDDDEEEETGDGTLQKAKQALTCRKVTLNTLMDDGTILPGEGVLSIDYLGQRFEADLLESGRIRWHGSEEEFGTPSAWALHCKRLVNPIKRSGCGWASVKYKGKKLDIWKSIWARKHRTSPFKTPHQIMAASAASSAATSSSAPVGVSMTTSTAVTASSPLSPVVSVTTTATSSAVVAAAAASSSSPVASDVTALSSSTSTPHEHHGNEKIETSTVVTSSSELKTSPDHSSLKTSPDYNSLKTSPDHNSQMKAPIPLPIPHPSTATSKSLSALLSTPPLDTKSIPCGSLVSPSLPSLLKDTGIKENSCSNTPNSHPTSSLKESILMDTPQVKSSMKGTPQASTALPLIPPTPQQPLPSSFSLSARTKRPSQSHFVTPHHKELTNQMTRERKCMRYSELDTRTPDIDMNTLVQCEPFDNHHKLQPFTVTVSTNAMLLMDFHCHLTRSEVVGYLGGQWDSTKQVLSVEQAFPVLCRFSDKLQAPVVEEEIRRRMKSRKLSLVGWYHSHPYCIAQPSLRDVDCQMAYQLHMRGAGATYHPCLGFIEAPYEKQDNTLQGFWVMPNLEHPASFNIPMHISYSIQRDVSLTEDILIDMKLLSEFYSGAPDRIRFRERWKEDITFLDKIRASLATKLPEDQLDSSTFLDYTQQLLREMK